MFRTVAVVCAAAIAIGISVASANAAETTITLPSGLHWLSATPKGGTSAYQYSVIRGKEGKCDTIYRNKFPDGFVFPWHTNSFYGIFTVLQGTLVIGFDRNHAKSAEKMLPAGSVMQGLGEPHYGRAIGETIFDVYAPCGVH